MAASLLPEAAQKVFSPETLRSAAKQSEGIHLVPLSLRRAIKKFLRGVHMNRKVLLLSESFNKIKDANLQLAASTYRDLVDDPFRPVEHRAGRWKIQSAYGDIGLKYRDDETVAYVASRMPAVYSACHRVLREVRRRLPDFSPSKVLDFGAGPGSALCMPVCIARYRRTISYRAELGMPIRIDTVNLDNKDKTGKVLGRQCEEWKKRTPE
ncbi:hypothetical protein B296_00013320 [Ensete ventricosum]|uniref:Uncharacterized protein n=1 Tax=Ensete ventricosum TaxID=4639 RepID=A0A427B163_ENSVE|nr:hypothetical protein B296_00013320 [Ensete ventricosum]